jgi:transcriptional regulator with XRE-family HTH domain
MNHRGTSSSLAPSSVARYFDRPQVGLALPALALRRRRGLSQERLAFRSLLRRRSGAKGENPTVDVLDRLAKTLAVHLSEFLVEPAKGAAPPATPSRPPSVAESRPPVDNCAYSSSSAGMRPARKKTTGSSKSPSSASPVRDHAITPTLLCARRSAVRRAASSDLHATDGSARRRVPRPARKRLHDVDCFPSQVTDLHSGRSAATEFINGQAL